MCHIVIENRLESCTHVDTWSVVLAEVSDSEAQLADLFLNCFQHLAVTQPETKKELNLNENISKSTAINR